jgi:hypothetical protein
MINSTAVLDDSQWVAVVEVTEDGHAWVVDREDEEMKVKVDRLSNISPSLDSARALAERDKLYEDILDNIGSRIKSFK